MPTPSAKYLTTHWIRLYNMLDSFLVSSRLRIELDAQHESQESNWHCCRIDAARVHTCACQLAMCALPRSGTMQSLAFFTQNVTPSTSAQYPKSLVHLQHTSDRQGYTLTLPRQQQHVTKTHIIASTALYTLKTPMTATVDAFVTVTAAIAVSHPPCCMGLGTGLYLSSASLVAGRNC